MRLKKHIALLLFFMIAVFPSISGQEGYKIKFEVRNLRDSICYLVNYKGEKTYLIDTARVKKESFVFKGDKSLDKGMYMIAGQSKNRYLDFIINDASRIRFITDTSQWISHLTVKGSPENRLFFDYVMYLDDKRQMVDSLNAMLTSDTVDQERKAAMLAMVLQINQEVMQHQKSLVRDHKDTFFAKFLQASLEPDVYELLKKEFNTPKRDSLLYEYKAHFWDNFDLTDDRLLHSPLYYKRLEWYMNDFVFPVPDTIIRVIDSMLLRVSSNKPVYEYLLWYFTLKYEQSKIMGFDEVFVHMSNAYYKTGKADYINETVRKNVINRTRVLEPLLIGKRAPEMILLDTSDNEISLYQTDKAYTVIYFWDTDCSFCTKETPKLQRFYKENKDSLNVGVYAVCIDTSMAEWKKFIRNDSLDWINVNGYLSITEDFHNLYDVHSSPVIYLLDKDMKIIAKNILTEQLLGIITRKENEKRNAEVKNKQ